MCVVCFLFSFNFPSKKYIHFLTAVTVVLAVALVVVLAHKQIPLMAYCGDFNGHNMHKKRKKNLENVFSIYENCAKCGKCHHWE